MMSNIDTINFMVEILEAYKSGKKIEYRVPKHGEKLEDYMSTGEWISLPEGVIPDFFRFVYRIKPETKIYRPAILLNAKNEPYIQAINNFENAMLIQQNRHFVKWASENWIEYEV